LKKLTHLAERATYLLAYNAMLKAGRALMLLKGYVPDCEKPKKTFGTFVQSVLGSIRNQVPSLKKLALL
jgi:hypothetical protein